MIYLDNAATTQPKFFGKDFHSQYGAYTWANPNAMYAIGQSAHNVLDNCRNAIKAYLGVDNGTVLFCRSATEAVQWLARCYPWESIQAYPCNHDSVYDCRKNTSRHYDENGCFLYLGQYVNQMTGIYQYACMDEDDWVLSNMFNGIDLTATIGHAPLYPGIGLKYYDAAWFSGHKFHCEKGIGAIWISDRLVKLLNLPQDSRNEYGAFHGTTAVSLAWAMTNAMRKAVRKDITEHNKTFKAYNGYLLDYLQSHGINADIVGFDENYKTHYINTLILPGINGDSLVNYLSEKAIYIGPGHSACSDTADYRVLKDSGVPEDKWANAVRLSYNEKITMDDLMFFAYEVLWFKHEFLD